jgi:hypothetical protein
MGEADAQPTHAAADGAGSSVSPNNPCPFLRALVAGGHLSGHVEPLSRIADTVVASSRGSPPESPLPEPVVYLIALVANGLSPARLARNIREGAQLDTLRRGPLNKRGAGSRILDATGQVDQRELARLDQFAADKVDAASGAVERGLGIEQLRVMMDANFARAVGKRRWIDRRLMEGEFPILLRVMGKPSAQGRYLSVTELRTLFLDCRLPQRITQRLEKP